MDKYEYKIRSEEISRLIEKEKYAEAVAIADKIDWRRVKSATMLLKIAALYRVNRRSEDCRAMLQLAYDRYPTNRSVLHSLCEVSIELGDVVAAIEYYKQFAKLAPRDNGVVTLRYRILEAQEASLEERIELLEELKKRDYQEEWAYELAYLYHRVGLATKCVEECDDLILWFGEGTYVMKAMELKMLHTPLTAVQQKRYEAMLDSDYSSDYSNDNGGYDDNYGDDQDYNDNDYSENYHESNRYREDGYAQEDYQQGYAEEEYGNDNDADTAYVQNNFDSNALNNSYTGEFYVEHIYGTDDYPTGSYQESYGNENYPEELYSSEAYADVVYSDEQRGNESYTEEDYAGGDFSTETYPEDTYSNETYTEEAYSDENYVDKTYQDGTYPDENYADKTYQDGTYPNENYADETYQEGIYPDENYVDGAYQEENYSDETYSGDAYPDEPVNKPVPSVVEPNDMSRYNTINLQKVVADGMKEISLDDLPEEEAPLEEAFLEKPESRTGFREITVEDNTPPHTKRVEELLDGISEEAPAPDTGAIRKVILPGNNARVIKEETDIEELRDTTERSVGEEQSRIENTGENIFHEQDIFNLSSEDPKAIIGAAGLENVLVEWERVKREIEQRRKEKVRQHVLSQTGKIFENFDNSIKSGILGELDKEEPDIKRESAGDNFLQADVTSDIEKEFEQAEIEDLSPSEELRTDREAGIQQATDNHMDIYPEEHSSEEGYFEEGYNQENYPGEGYNEESYSQEGYYEDRYPEEGYNEEHYSQEGYNEERYSQEGDDEKWYPEEGYSQEGYLEDSYGDVVDSSAELGEVEEVSEDSTVHTKTADSSQNSLKGAYIKEANIKETGIKESGIKENGIKETSIEETSIEETSIKDTDIQNYHGEAAYVQEDTLGESYGSAEYEQEYNPNEYYPQDGYNDMAYADDIGSVEVKHDEKTDKNRTYVRTKKPLGNNQEETYEKEVYEEEIYGQETHKESDSDERDIALEDTLTIAADDSAEENQSNVYKDTTYTELENPKKNRSEGNRKTTKHAEAENLPQSVPQASPESARARTDAARNSAPLKRKPTGRTTKISTKTGDINIKASAMAGAIASAVEKNAYDEELDEEREAFEREKAEQIAEMAKEDALKTQEIKMNTADLSSLSDKIMATTKKEAKGAKREDIREFTPEEQALFENFAVTKKIKKQILYALDNMSLAAYTGNVIVTGDAGLDTVRMAKNLARRFQQLDTGFSGKIAKITGDKINIRNLKEIFDKLANGAIIIEKANGMLEEKLYEMAMLLNRKNFGLVVIMEDTRKEITKLLKKQAMIADYFNIRIDLMEMDNNALVAYARNYALALEYSIDELGILALYTRIANIQSGNHVVTKDEVRDIIDEAIWKSKKSKVKNFVDVLFSKRYDSEDMIVLKERDFI